MPVLGSVATEAEKQEIAKFFPAGCYFHREEGRNLPSLSIEAWRRYRGKTLADVCVDCYVQNCPVRQAAYQPPQKDTTD